MIRSKSRREVLLGAAALAGTAALPRTASAQAKGRIVVGTWGGDYARLLNKNIEVPILIKDGWEVVQDQAGDPERRSKMIAELRLPRGTSKSSSARSWPRATRKRQPPETLRR